jgi:putative transposase
MPRKPTQKTAHYPYHIYNRVNSKKKYPPLLLEAVWKIYCDELCVMSWAYGVEIHIFVLMNNHYHLVVETPEANISEAMLQFQREVSKRVKELTCSQDFRFQARYKCKTLENEIQYSNTYRYVALNPVESKLASSPIEFRYSSLFGQFGGSALEFPIFEKSRFTGLLPRCMAEREHWLGGRV